MTTPRDPLETLDDARRSIRSIESVWSLPPDLRRLSWQRARAEEDASALNDLADALQIENKTTEELISSLVYVRTMAPGVKAKALDAAAKNAVERCVKDFKEACEALYVDEAKAKAGILEACGEGDRVERAFECVAWRASTLMDWCDSARRFKKFAFAVVSNEERALRAFERAALVSVQEYKFGAQGEDNARSRAGRAKNLIQALPDLKEASGTEMVRTRWDDRVLDLKKITRADAERVVLEAPLVRWTFQFHGVDPAAVEAFSLLQRCGDAGQPPASVLNGLLHRLKDSSSAGEIYAMLGSCNTIDYIVGYLDGYSPERTVAMNMLKSSKDNFVKRACAELDREGDQFVKEIARFFHVQNPVLRTELRLEISRAWKSHKKLQTSGVLGQSMNFSNLSMNESALNASFPSFSTERSQSGEVGQTIALFFEASGGGGNLNASNLLNTSNLNVSNVNVSKLNTSTASNHR